MTASNKKPRFAADAATGWVSGARIVRSPNHDARPPGSGIDTIVIHNITLPPDEFGGEAVEQLFTNQLDFDAHPYYRKIRGLEVSAHFFIQRNGDVTQFVSINDRAWHAGESFFYGRSRVNDFSVGVEIEGTDHVPFESAQYASAADLVLALMNACPQTAIERLCGHSDIAPGRKTDPGPHFDWERLRRLICRQLTPN